MGHDHCRTLKRFYVEEDSNGSSSRDHTYLEMIWKQWSSNFNEGQTSNKGNRRKTGMIQFNWIIPWKDRRFEANYKKQMSDDTTYNRLLVMVVGVMMIAWQKSDLSYEGLVVIIRLGNWWPMVRWWHSSSLEVDLWTNFLE